MKYVAVKFVDKMSGALSAKDYIYKTDLDLDVDDNVVVETYKGPVTAIVTVIDPLSLRTILEATNEGNRIIKYVICKFDMTHVEELKAEEARIEFTKQKIKDAYRKKMLNQLADELIAELPELKDEIELARQNNDLERLLGDDV